MYIDTNLTFCASEDVSAAAGTEVIAAAIDLQAAGVRLNVGQPGMYLVISVETAFASAGAATIQFRLVSDSTDPTSTDGTESMHLFTRAFGYATLTAGKKIILPLPSGFPAYERYLQLQVVTGGATTTAGTINAFLTANPDDWVALAEAVS